MPLEHFTTTDILHLRYRQNRFVGLVIGGLDVRGKQGLLLLLIFVLAFIFMKSALVDSFGTCDYCGPNYWENYPTQSEIEQSMWNSEIYYFLNYDNCDNLYKAAYKAANSNPVSNQVANNTTASYWLDNANKLYLAGYYEQAAASYAKALKLDSSQSVGRINMATSLYFLGRYKESLDAYNAVIASDPLNANAILGKGKVLMAMNRTQGTNATLKKVGT
jgi:tetratricopeptide (TPR) repeat protein